MEEIKDKPVRIGLHKYFHISKFDTYFYATLSICFLALVIFKVINRMIGLGFPTPYISWVSAMQLAILWAILGIVSHGYYLKHEKIYD